MPPLALSSQVACAYLYMMYGFGIGEWTVWACNISGFVLGVFYLLVYPFYWKTKEVVDFGNHAAKKNSSTLDTKDIECAPNVSLYKSKQVPIYRRQFIRQTVIVVLTIVVVFVLFSVLPEKNKGPAFWLKNEDYELEDSDAAFPLLVEAIGWGSACTSILLSIHPLVVLHEVPESGRRLSAVASYLAGPRLSASC